jgi:hypothetical protein
MPEAPPVTRADNPGFSSIPPLPLWRRSRRWRRWRDSREARSETRRGKRTGREKIRVVVHTALAGHWSCRDGDRRRQRGSARRFARLGRLDLHSTCLSPSSWASFPLLMIDESTINRQPSVGWIRNSGAHEESGHESVYKRKNTIRFKLMLGVLCVKMWLAN